MLPLSKCFDPADLVDLVEELKIVDQQDLSGQAACRRFEYAMALRAFETWGGKASDLVTDVGGAGSPFWKMLNVDNVFIADPKENVDLQAWVANLPRLSRAVFCLSVIEHVEDLDQFLYHLSCLVAPGGLLVLTTDVCDNDAVCPVDGCHYHWMRKRIFSSNGMRYLLDEMYRVGQFYSLGDINFDFTVPMENWGYTVASLVLRKRS